MAGRGHRTDGGSPGDGRRLQSACGRCRRRPPPLPTPQLYTYTTPSFSTLNDNISIVVAGVQLKGLACVKVGEGQQPLFDQPLRALQWLRMLLSAGAPKEFTPSVTIAGCVAECRTRLRDETVWDAAASMGFGARPTVLHIRPNTPKTATAARLRQDTQKKGQVEVYATYAAIEDICTAAECALALAGGAEPDLGAPDEGVATADRPRLVAAQLPKDMFSILGSDYRSDDDDDSISTSSAVSKLLHSDQDAEDCGDPAAEGASASRIITGRNPPLPIPPPAGPSPPSDRLIAPLKSIFIPKILYALYLDPIRTSSEAWTKRLREEWACSRPAFDRMESSLFYELNHEPALIHLTERGSAAYSFKQISFKGAMEAAVFMGMAKNLVSKEFRNSFETHRDGAPTPIITIYIYLDAAGRVINGCKVTILYLIPLIYTAVGSLHVLVPVACHIGRWTKAQATAFWSWVAPDLRMVHHITFAGIRFAVRWKFGPDMAELWNSMTVRHGNIPWIASDTQGMAWFGKGCSGYDDRSMHTALSRKLFISEEMPSLPRHDVQPVFVGTDLSVPYLQAPVHRLIHTIGKHVAELACAYASLGYLGTAYHLVDCFPRTASWNPVPEAPVRSRKHLGRVEEGGDPESASGSDAEPAAFGAGEPRRTKKPASTPRCKDVACFLQKTGPWGGGDRPQWTDAEGASQTITRHRPNHEDVRALLADTPIILEDGTTVEALWVDLVDFVTVTCLERRIPPEQLQAYRTKGMRILERWRLLCKYYRPWSPQLGGTIPTHPRRGDDGSGGSGSSRPARTEDGTGPLTEALWFRTKCLPEQREATLEAAKAIEFDYPLCAIGPAGIDALDHGTKTFEELSAQEAFAFTEQAGDHFFSYLYHTIPAVSARILKGKANATTIWKIILEIWCAGYPAPPANSRRGRLIKNSAYI